MYSPLIPPYYNPNGFVWVMDERNQGQLVPIQAATISVLAQALHYGTCGVFEGVTPNKNGVIFREREHTERLIASLEMVGGRLPSGLTAEGLKVAQYQLLDAMAKLEGTNELYMRPWAGLDSTAAGIAPGKNPATVFIAAWKWPSYFGKKEGLNLEIASWRKPDPRSVPVAAKACGNYVSNGLAKGAALKAGFDDALMLHLSAPGEDPEIAEATGANVFFVDQQGRVVTPRVVNEDGVGIQLNGITRRTMIEEVMPHLGIECDVRVVRLSEISKMRAAFLCGTAARVAAVGKIADHQLDAQDPVVRQIADTYTEHFNAQADRDHYSPLWVPSRRVIVPGGAGAEPS